MMNTNWSDSQKTDGTDRISSLPDDVLTHVLSFLSTREAVQTCILSKRWIKTWASVTDLNFDIKEFGVPDIKEFGRANNFDKFKMLVKNVLEKRETSCVNRFRLWLDSFAYYCPCTQAAVNWIGDVMKMEPRECSVKLCLHENLNLNTDAIFTCASLIYLQLCLFIDVDCCVAMEPNSVNLPCLKTLNLAGVTIRDDSLKKLLLGSPVLEELVLENCYISIIEICSNTLKKLVLCNCHDIMRLQISTPNLYYLDIFVWDIEEILLLNMSSLVNASICIPCWFDRNIYLTMAPKLIHNLSNVESLRLELVCPKGKVHKKDFSSCASFNNLKHLELLLRLDKGWGFYVFDLVLFFLHQSPELLELTLYGYALVTEFVDEEITQEGTGDELVQREFLKTVRIVGFTNDSGFVNQFINKLLTHVKIIGDIVIDP